MFTYYLSLELQRLPHCLTKEVTIFFSDVLDSPWTLSRSRGFDCWGYRDGLSMGHLKVKQFEKRWNMQCNITLTRGGMYWKLRPPRTERFAEVLILHPEAREIARGRSPRAISRAEGCKINAEANLEVRGGRNFQWIPTLVSVITFFFPRRGCFDFSFWPAHCVL